MNLGYKRYEQEDAFETLNNLLNNLNYSFEAKKMIKSLFSLEMYKKCDCMPRHVREESMFPLLN